jgi:hypothetical protein
VKQVLPDEPIPPPSSVEQGAILDDVREYVANYDNNLPDFVCTEVEHRLIAAEARNTLWRAARQRPVVPGVRHRHQSPELLRAQGREEAHPGEQPSGVHVV